MAPRLSTPEWNLASLLLGIFAFPSTLVLSNDRNYLSKSEIYSWAEDLDLRLTSSLETISGIPVLEKSFSDLGKAKLVPVDGPQLVYKLSAELTNYLQKKMNALQRLVKKAEDEVSKYKYDQNIQKEDVKWVSVKPRKEPKDQEELIVEYSEKFRKGVNYNDSGVHIPIEIYEGYPDILNGLNWSGKLDEVFKLNMKEDPTLLWQYFGSQTGFMRSYPASKWETSSEFPDLFDVRRRPWYINGSSSPKDMLVLLDISGSMHGQTMEIMKISVKTLLNTLGEDDFVNVAKFSNETEWVSCFKTFVQATRRNKLKLFEDIDTLKDGNMASLSIGLKFAFMEFENFERNRSEWEGSNCHKVIVVFTDGGTEEAWDVLKKYNKDKNIRIFTFAVGPHPVPYATIKEIACHNKGYFSSVPSMGATRLRAQWPRFVQDYVKVLSRPMVLSNQREFQWTNFYLDASGLGVLTTVTLPVFNRSDPFNDTMVGVMGVDVTVRELMDKEPRYEMGPGGYSFAINHNGLVVYHPDLDAQIKGRMNKNNILDDSPHTDFLDIEVENEARNEIRTAMINQSTGSIVVNGLIELPDMKHAVIYPLRYHFTPINQTQFSLGIAVLESRTHYIKGGRKDQRLGLQQSEQDEILLAPWKYCHDQVFTKNMSQNFQNIIDSTKMDPRLCDEQLLERMIWDIDRTRAVIDYWRRSTSKGERNDVLATFVSTDGGVTRVYPYSMKSNLSDLADPREALFFERALYGKGYVFLLPQSYPSGNDTRVKVTFVKAMRLMNGGNHFVPGVAGAILDEDHIKNLLKATPGNPKGPKTNLHCSKTDSVLCYLLDDGGFVIASNQVDQPFVAGKFLGDTDPALMHELYEKEVYKSFFAFLWPTVESVPEFEIYVSDSRSCTTLLARYYVEGKQDYASNFTCKGQTRHYSVATVGETNLLLVVTNAAFDCTEKPSPIQGSTEVDGPDLCSPEVRYRRRPGKCFAHHPNDNNTECGSAVTPGVPDRVILTGLALVIICSRFF